VNNKADTSILEINETNDDRLLSVFQLKEKYIEYVKSHFIKTPHLAVVNKNTKWKIEITTQVIKEWRQKSRTRPRIIAICILDKMIKTAIMGITASPCGRTDLNITVSATACL